MKFYLPDFCQRLNLNLYIIDLLQKYPEYFYDGIEIGAVYGAFPPAIWNGGRLIIGGALKQDIEETISELNKRGVSIRYTYTNSLIEERHLQDTYCNLTMEIANNGMNEVIVNSPILEAYLRDKYPNFKYILSTTRCERDIDKINEATKNYDLVVTDYRDNQNLTFLQSIHDKSKIELLVNAYCDPKCPMRMRHYEAISRHQINYEAIEPEQDKFFLDCPTYNRDFYDIFQFPSVLTTKDIYGKYSRMGFSNFKIEGRTMPVPQIIESYLYYLIKPEYKDKVRLEILKNFIGH